MSKKKKNIIKDEDLKRDIPLHPNQEIKLIIDIPPSVNHCYYTRRNGARVYTKDAQNWIKKMKAKCLQKVDESGWKEDKKHVWYFADMHFYFPDKRIRDSHNTFKVMFDAIEGIVFHNDYYIMPRVQGVWLDRQNPRVEIIITPTTQTKPTKLERIIQYMKKVIK